jgi:hypothetical protein
MRFDCTFTLTGNLNADGSMSGTYTVTAGPVIAGVTCVPPTPGLTKPSGAVSNGAATSAAFGGIINLTISAPFPLYPEQMTSTGYILDATHISLIETDGSVFTAGPAIAQAGAPGSFTCFSGTYVFGMLGDDLSSNFLNTMTSAGWFDGDNGSGHMDTAFQAYFNPLSGVVGAQISADFGGLTAPDTRGIGRVFSALAAFVPPVSTKLLSFVHFLSHRQWKSSFGSRKRGTQLSSFGSGNSLPTSTRTPGL